MNVAEFLNPDAWLLSDGGPRYLQLRQRQKGRQDHEK